MTEKQRTGVAVGKFNPPHLGHRYMLSVAAGQVEQLFVLLGDRPDQTIPARDRASWLAETLPDNCSIIITPDDLPADNVPWAQRALEVLPHPPDVAFTSEAWGEGWAAAMGAEHIGVDPNRTEFPIAATQLRNDLAAHFSWLVPPARAGLAKRIVLAGAESTGKTTLARKLAAQLGAVWVPEYGRFYWESRRHRPDQSWSAEEFSHIARTHHTIADAMARECHGGLMIMDTDALVTQVWQERYGAEGDGEVAATAASNRPDLYLVCAPDFEWVQDGSRESQRHRQAMHARTLELAGRSGSAVEVLTGPVDARMECARRLIDAHATFDLLI